MYGAGFAANTKFTSIISPWDSLRQASHTPGCSRGVGLGLGYFPRKNGTPRHLGVNRAPRRGTVAAEAGRRRQCVASASRTASERPDWREGARPPVCRPEQRVSSRPHGADVSPCLWWSGVAARGRRPTAMDGRRNGHGRRRSSCVQPSTSDESPRTRLIAGQSRLWTGRVTPK